jgi:hypothetical protein
MVFLSVGAVCLNSALVAPLSHIRQVFPDFNAAKSGPQAVIRTNLRVFWLAKF